MLTHGEKANKQKQKVPCLFELFFSSKFERVSTSAISFSQLCCSFIEVHHFQNPGQNLFKNLYTFDLEC